MSFLQQPFCTLGNVERTGIATKAIQALPLLTRRDAVKQASGLIEPFLRKRHLPPFVVAHDPDFDDLSGMTGGAVPIWSLAEVGPVTVGGQARPADILLAFPTGGTVGAPGITYQVTAPDAGAFNTTSTPTMLPGPVRAFPLSGIITLFGYPFQLPVGATVANGDSVYYCLRTDAGLTGIAVSLAAFLMLNARGVDPKTGETMAAQLERVDAWAKAVAEGGGDLGKDADATPAVQEGGVRFKAGQEQQSAYGWVPCRGDIGPGGLLW